MKKRHVVTLASVVLLLGTSGGATAQTPADGQYGAGNVGGETGGEAAPTGSGSLPFTGFEAGLVALGGAGLAVSGLALRRTTRAKRQS